MLCVLFTNEFSADAVLHASAGLLSYDLCSVPAGHCLCRSQGYAAHVRIASQDNVMHAEDYDEILSFGTYPSSQNGPFQPHASLTAQANGSLSVKAAGLKLLPGGGETSIGSGKSFKSLNLQSSVSYSAENLNHPVKARTCTCELRIPLSTCYPCWCNFCKECMHEQAIERSL